VVLAAMQHHMATAIIIITNRVLVAQHSPRSLNLASHFHFFWTSSFLPVFGVNI